MGVLTPGNQIKRDNLFEGDTVVQLLIHVPEDTLLASNEAAKLLAHHLLQKPNFDTLYQHPLFLENTPKRIWLEDTLHHSIKELKSRVPSATLEAISTYHALHKLIPLLNTLPHTACQTALFSLILKRPQGLNSLSDPRMRPHFFDYLKRQDMAHLLGKYILEHHEHPGFNKMLETLSEYAHDHQLPNLLEAIPDAAKQTLLTCLTKNTKTADILVRYFLTSQQALETFTASFDKGTFLNLLQNLTTPLDPCDKRYQLALTAFTTHQEKLLPKEELRYDAKRSWQHEDLKSLIRFYHHHEQLFPNPLDPQGEIAAQLLNAITLRAANHGLTELFYPGGHFDPWVTAQVLTQSPITPTSWFKKIKAFFMGSSRIESQRAFLMREQALVNWSEVAESSPGRESLFTLHTFLYHYSGESKDVITLLQDCLNSSVSHAYPELPSGISRLMARHPENTISSVIFHALENTLTQKPHLLTPSFLEHMVTFHQRGTHHSMNEGQSELIKHFGKLKHYGLILRICELLKPTASEDPSFALTLKCIHQEASHELFLQSKKDSWYFKFAAWFLRTGFFQPQPSQWLTYCEDDIDYIHPVDKPDKVKTSLKSGREISEELQAHAIGPQLQELRSRLQAVRGPSFFTASDSPGTDHTGSEHDPSDQTPPLLQLSEAFPLSARPGTP